MDANGASGRGSISAGGRICPAGIPIESNKSEDRVLLEFSELNLVRVVPLGRVEGIASKRIMQIRFPRQLLA